jgi:hypothetical protein
MKERKAAAHDDVARGPGPVIVISLVEELSGFSVRRHAFPAR